MSDTETFIKDAASRGWSRNEVCRVLGISWGSLQAILEIIPPLNWVPGNQSLSRRRSNEQRRGFFPPAARAAQLAAIEKRRQDSLLEVRGTRGTMKELAKVWGVSPSTVRRRMNDGQSLEQALTTPPTPRNLRRQGLKVQGS
ncbi:hypothetical protein H8F21_14060 [Pseudomonas sp. P66]|uniref:Helix-turn-helix domain-containing protein n=1 Tax=Pseudomonas arcuscaelestis TaxID=2710591 RepID=A0ABS2C0X9_9PSED|nr:hypothetical protein [Pseudomonas arcuscaelestis]MBM5458689.1 hypothetical protein [Pseudomonas arcuscaelestis]